MALATSAAAQSDRSTSSTDRRVAQRRSSRHRDERRPFGYGREAYFWALIAALGAFIAGAAFSLREGISALIHPSTTTSFTVAYIVLGICTIFDLVSLRQSAHQMSVEARLANRNLLDQSAPTSDPSLRADFLLAYDGVSAIRELLVTYIGPSQVRVLARINIADDLRSHQVTSLVRGIETELKRQSPYIYRVDIVPVGQE